jgi:hypothetical protein
MRPIEPLFEQGAGDRDFGRAEEFVIMERVVNRLVVDLDIRQ